MSLSFSALAGLGTPDINQQKLKAIQRLAKRKKAFEEYLALQKSWEQKRDAVAFKQKKIRRDFQRKKEEARKKFVRKIKKKDIESYRKFMEKRRQRRQFLQRAQANYQVMQRALRKVYKNKKYRISGKKEFKL